MSDDISKLTQLGRPVGVPASPDQAVLERVANPHPALLYCARFTAPEARSSFRITPGRMPWPP